MGCAQTTGGKGFILCLCGAIPAPLLCGNLLCHCPSNWAEHLLIHRIQSHTNPKRRKGFLKQAGQKSFKEELPKQRKGPKRAVKCRLKVPTHIWEKPPGQSYNFISGCCAVGSAPALGAGGPGFESPHSDHLSQKNRLFRRFFCIFSLIFAILVIAVLRRFLGQKSGGHMIEDCS